jgi:hypothetical protein
MGMEPFLRLPGMQDNHSQRGETVELTDKAAGAVFIAVNRAMDVALPEAAAMEERVAVAQDTLAFFQERIAGRGKHVHPDVLTGLCLTVSGLLEPTKEEA